MRWFNMKKRLAAIALAVVAATAIAVPSAFAAGVYDDALDAYDIGMIPTTALTPNPNIPTVAATRAAMPAAEILGLYSVEESGQFIDMQNGQPVYSWEKPKYMLLASNYRTDPSPYLVNLAIGGSPAAIYNPSRAGGGSGPNASLSSTDADGDDQLVLAMNPTVIVGTGGGTAGYTGTGVAYGFSNNSGLVTTLENIATESGSTNATAQALAYRQYIFGTIGLVHRAIQDESQPNVTERSVVLIENATKVGNQWTYDVMTSVEATGQNVTNGTASRNRYLEVTSNTGLLFTGSTTNELRVASNLADSLTGTITADDIAAADLIMVGGQQGSANYTNIMTALFDDQLLDQTYFVADNGSAGACYGVVMNSVENAQNVGRILGMLYPEVINQHNWMGYYYQTFYGIDSDDLTTVLRKAMQGVRNATATTTASTLAQAIADLTDWSGVTVYEDGATQSSIAGSLASGYAYISSLVTLP